MSRPTLGGKVRTLRRSHGALFVFQLAAQGKWGNFIAQWVPTWLIIGLYNKLVKLEGHDQSIAEGNHVTQAYRTQGRSGYVH
jgi:hypothetical protein